MSLLKAYLVAEYLWPPERKPPPGVAPDGNFWLDSIDLILKVFNKS